ncbi:uncharacterized protein LOC121197344 [Toxotes jaculatrix]|uniref:uncharacterized protein LOC121197344 n=1 Tax=Toxotes jaculatrix TaxID=941984 RepID=UPI001B3AA30F|nr:uncharacterized protein LOC121197344 [Toxotes jaculatrix]
MSPAISIALLLLSATVVESYKSADQKEKKKDFPSHLEHYEGERAENGEEEILEMELICTGCVFAVSQVEKIIGNEKSKKKIEQLLNNACNGVGITIIRWACKTIIGWFKNKLIDGIANHESPRSICVKLKLCTDPPVHR